MTDEAAEVNGRDPEPEEASRSNAIRESRVRRFLGGLLAGSACVVMVCLVALCGRPLRLSAQTLYYAKPPDARNGEKVYKGGCIACHGSEGKGAPMASTVFTRPDGRFTIVY